MDDMALTTLQQIHDREYFHGLSGEILMYGVAVCRKDVVVSSETVSLP